MKPHAAFLSLALCCFVTGMAAAQSTNGISAGIPDTRVLSLHEKVDDLFKRGEVGRAYFIYRNELVPLGDKYAQYMVGYMYLTGLAVDQDLVAASAWYRLAAERGTPEFVALRDRLVAELNDEQRRDSDALYKDLHSEYCDLAILLTSIKRLRSEASKVRDQIRLDPAQAPNYTRIRREIGAQTRVLAKLGGFTEMEADPDKFSFAEIERMVDQRIAETID